MFQPETCLKLKAGQKSWGMKGNGDWGKHGMVVHWGSEWLFLKKRRGSSSQAENRILKSPSISQEELGHAKIILRQRKCWVWGLMPHKKHVFLKHILNPHYNSTKKAVAESCILLEVMIILPSHKNFGNQPPSRIGLLLLSWLAGGGPHALLRRV